MERSQSDSSRKARRAGLSDFVQTDRLDRGYCPALRKLRAVTAVKVGIRLPVTACESVLAGLKRKQAPGLGCATPTLSRWSVRV
jgi:hypothetical protein